MAFVANSISSAMDESTGTIYPLLSPIDPTQIGSYVDSSNVAGFNGLSDAQVAALEKGTPNGWVPIDQFGATVTSSSDASTLSTLTNGLLGVLSVGSQVADTALKNDTISQILRARGLPVVPAPKPAPAPAIPSWVAPVGLAALVGLVAWGASR